MKKTLIVLLLAVSFLCGVSVGQNQKRAPATSWPDRRELVVSPHGNARFVTRDKIKSFLSDPKYSRWVVLPAPELIEDLPMNSD